ncbi:nucleotidyl transferase AbiEii/AbiGii toxin family protein [uncultured Eubacterium sp.]|uniref:nucleotidyl transferase AbiEii/AbiGii toxin family protein n=1 Tax=uncultured Eubacterium sp. TaxID=165185 RepID=UPI00263A20DB|nr:nucleotidyl transferase AbiEii/AbiGii toxin family protein [uncultured Eubacterium sp.]
MNVENLNETRSRRDYNRYIISYNSVLPLSSVALKPAVLLETSYTAVSFPTVILPVHSYIGDMMKTEAPDYAEEFSLIPFSMKIQGIDRTLADKIFAICDYYLQGKEQKHSRHIYDIYKLLPLVRLDDNFKNLVNEVRSIRTQSPICPSALPLCKSTIFHGCYLPFKIKCLPMGHITYVRGAGSPVDIMICYLKEKINHFQLILNQHKNCQL